MADCLETCNDSLQTRGCVPIAARQSVQCVPVMARSLRRIKPEGTHKERSQMRIAQTLEWYTTAAHGDVVRWPNNEWSDRSLQVFDLKAAAAPSNSSVVEAI